jgi:hypothetical protein
MRKSGIQRDSRTSMAMEDYGEDIVKEDQENPDDLKD